MNNTKLKQLMKTNLNNMISSQLDEFFAEIKNSALLLAIDKNAKPLKLNYENQYFAPIFTDNDELDNFGTFSFIRYQTMDLLDFLIEEDIENIVINPASENPFAMSLDFLLSNCQNNPFDEISKLTNIIKKGVKPLEEIGVFYIKEKTPFMAENIKDGVFTSPIPISVSSNEDINHDFDYTNIIYVPKGVLIAEDEKNIILAPILKLRLIEQTQNTFTWQCIEQDFNIF